MKQYVAYLLILLTAWRLFWLLLYKISGLYISYLSVNNGISINGVCFSGKFNITASSIRLRLWGNSRKLVVTDLNIVVPPSTEKSKSRKLSDIKEGPVTIYPKSTAGKLIARLILFLSREINVELKDSRFSHEKLAIEAQTISFVVKSQVPSKSSKNYAINFQFSATHSSVYLRKPFRDHKFSTLASFNVLLQSSVCSKTGHISDTLAKLYIDDLETSVFHLFESLVSSNLSSQTNDSKISSLEEKWGNLAMVHKKIVSSFKECSINVANFTIKHIPLLPASTEASMSDYFNQSVPQHTLYCSVDSISLHFGRVLPNSAGFELHFDSATDIPLQVTFSFSLFKVGLANSIPLDCLPDEAHTDEILSLPNLSVTLKTNIIARLFNDSGFENCVLELYSSANSPVFDVDDNSIALLCYNYLVWRKFFTLRKLKKQHPGGYESMQTSMESEPEDEDDTQISITSSHPPEENTIEQTTTFLPPSLERRINSLIKFFPKIDIKLTIEGPKSIFRINDELEGKVQLLMICYSLMVLHVSTSDNQNYESKCNVIHPYMSFSERIHSKTTNEVFSEEFAGLADAKLDCKLSKDLKAKSNIEVDGVYIKLIKPDVLNGINRLIDQISNKISNDSIHGHVNKMLDEELPEHRKCTTRTKSSASYDNLFSVLPSWFDSFSLRCANFDIQLGSASPLLPSNFISKLSKVECAKFLSTESVLCLQIESYSLKIESADNHPDNYEPSINSDLKTSSSSDTLAEEEPKPRVFWRITSLFKEFKVSILGDSKSHIIFRFPKTCHDLTSSSGSKGRLLSLDNDLGVLCANIDRYKVFSALGSVYLFMQTIILPTKSLHEKLKKGAHSLKSHHEEKSEGRLSDILAISVSVSKSDLVFGFSDIFKLRVQNYGLRIDIRDAVPTATNKFTRVMAVSPINSAYWDRIMCIDDLKVIGNESDDSFCSVVEASSLRFFQPYKFVVYKLFDSLSEFMKVVKHLIKCFGTQEKQIEIYPKESHPLQCPRIRLKAANISFSIGDDPFETDLNMIYQLGLVEQRKRIEHYNLFENGLENRELSDDQYQSQLSSLHKFIATSWIRKVKGYKSRLCHEIMDNEYFLIGAEAQIPESENAKVTSYSQNAPLMSLYMTNVDMTLSQPKFPISELPGFIYKYGQRVPKSTKYNLMIPLHVDILVGELRMHMRDYPLPLLYLPNAIDSSGKGKALKMNGHLVLGETLILEEKHLRKLKVQLTKATDRPAAQPNTFDKIVIWKSLSTVKLFTDLDVKFDSDSPSRFVWGQSYQFAIQQIMLSVDQFSKPPVDPSPKLGFWDKLRLVIHGSLRITTGPEASIEVAFKGGRDPYDLFAGSNGFILRFKDSVVWKINEEDDPLKFFDVSAKRVSWYIPNYLSSSLIAWTRETSKPTVLAECEEFINSSHAYYLNPYKLPQELKKDNESNFCEKIIVDLSGGVKFTVGFLLQRQREKENVLTEDGLPHYEVNLYNPIYTSESHDSYVGFRSDRINMALSLVANTEDSYNTIHLSPGTFTHFFSWWSMFRGNTMLPIRRGKLFGESQKAQKFSEHLFTNKFLFDIKSLFMSHIYRNEELDSADDDYECIGMRAKIGMFVVDLHQRKQEILDVHEDLSKHKKVMKMAFNLGQVLLNKIDLRTVKATFSHDLYGTKEQKHENFFGTFKKSNSWLDYRDFDEAFSFSSRSSMISSEILPFLYSESFTYLRDTTEDKGHNEYAHENIHDCRLYNTEFHSSQIDLYKRRKDDLLRYSKKLEAKYQDSIHQRIRLLDTLIKESEGERRKSNRKGSISTLGSNSAESFHNKFLLVSMFLKWNESVRNQFMKYIHFVNLSSSYKKFLTQEFMSSLERLIEQQSHNEDISLASSESDLEHRRSFSGSTQGKVQSSADRIGNFDEIIREVATSQSISEDYKIEVISPQIQLHADKVKDSVVMITAPLLESKILTVRLSKDSSGPLNSKTSEKRYGIVLKDASVMVLDEDSIKSRELALEAKPYGTKTNWPPFLGVETCRSHDMAYKEDMLVDQMSFMLMFKQVVASSGNIEQIENYSESTPGQQKSEEPENNTDQLSVDIPKLVIRSTSKQYYTLYATVLTLILYVEPMTAARREKVSKLNFSIDFQDLRALHGRLTNLHEYLKIVRALLKNYNFRQNGKLNNEDLNNYLSIIHKKNSLENEIVLLLQTLFTGDFITNTSTRVVQNWKIATDEVVFHMLNDDRSSIIDLRIDRGLCKRLVKDDGSNDNRIEIQSIEGHNLLTNSYYKEFLEPRSHSPRKNLITVVWSMNRSIGGIRVMDKFNISSLPLNLRVDEETGRSLLKFIFHQNDNEDLDRSPILNINRKSECQKSDNLTDKQEESDSVESDDTTSGTTKNRSLGSKKSSKQSSLSTNSTQLMNFDKDVDSMIQRSAKFLSIGKFTSHSFELMISLKMKNGIKRWLNVTNFLLVLPKWEIENKIMSFIDIIDIFKKLVTRALVRHSGSLVKNKVTSKRRNRRHLKGTLVPKDSLNSATTSK